MASLNTQGLSAGCQGTSLPRRLPQRKVRRVPWCLPSSTQVPSAATAGLLHPVFLHLGW